LKKTTAASSWIEDWGYCGMGSGILYRIHSPCFDYLGYAPIEYVHSDEIPVPYNTTWRKRCSQRDRIVTAVKEVCYR